MKKQSGFTMVELMIVISIVGILIATGFTILGSNWGAKKFGGVTTVEIPADQKFVDVTWKQSNLWILTTPRALSDTAKTNYTFQEKSNWGVLEGSVLIQEK